MAFNDTIENLDNACLSAFGESATFHPQSGGSIAITGITAPSPVEDTLYGATPGVVNVYFFVRYVDLSPKPKRGDIVTYGGASYDVADVLVDSGGGATLKLRRNS